ncbi:unnamed protein product, partial [Mesorhabditis belari]|uniref:Uncharacterized protein n=1 Tax=Mesorhabditis belari TaxID=2138241 RepID=A0AAF3F5C5_9BILA
MNFLVYFLVIIGIVEVSSAAPRVDTETQCMDVLKLAGTSDWFGVNVGHAIHSMSVRILQRFEPTTNENNSVPTINMDSFADPAILPNAPDRRGPSDAMYLTDGMKTLDEVLSHMNEKGWDIKYFSPLERVVHAFHMEEAWAMVLKEYEMVKQNPPSSTVCSCARDVENNGVLKMLRFTAIAIRDGPLVYGNKLSSYSKPWEYYVKYTYHMKPQKEEKVYKKDENWISLDQLLMTEKKSMPPLKDAQSWEQWKDIGEMKMAEHFDTALFLYCSLNKI